MSASYETQLNDWVNKEKLGVDLLNSVGTLMYDKGIELILFRNQLLEIGVSELMNSISYANKVVNRKVNIETAAELANEMLNIDLAPSKLDIGLLSAEYFEQGATDANAFLTEKLANFIGADKGKVKPKDVILYGFGRIGRLAARELIKQAGKGQQLRLKAIVVRRLTDAQIIKRADLLRNDSVHGAFKGVVDVDLANQAIVVNGQVIKFIDGGNPEDIDYTIHGINNALLIDNTGAFTEKEALSRHLQSKGVSKVLLTAPGKGIPNIVYGINSKEIDVDATDIFSAASCTTNCLAPVCKILTENFTVVKGSMSTIHGYTADQNIQDAPHSDLRRARAAAINIVPTTTGAAIATAMVVPAIKDKLTSMAFRVPIPTGSVIELNVLIEETTDVDRLKALFKKHADTDMKGILEYSTDPLVSCDIVGNKHSSILDSQLINVMDGNLLKIVSWYDNEAGYSSRLADLAVKVG
jgi:glyceraldehyde 3-phosphate dehydrogenase